MNGFHLTLTGIATFLSVVGSAGAIYRFIIAPRLAVQRAAMEKTREFRREAIIWMKLLEEDSPPETARRRKALIGDLPEN